jgi:hypothetical protein
MKVKLLLFTHPEWHMMLGSYKIISPNYILCRIELEAKRYGIKNSIAKFMNQLSCTLDATNVLEYIKQGRALLLLVSKQNLKPSFWCI